MWFWLFVIIFVSSVITIIIGRHSSDWIIRENTSLIGLGFAIISGLVVMCMLALIGCSHSNVEANLEKNRETYTALIYKMESTTCRDEFGFLSKEVIDEVQEWNKDVRFYQSAQTDFWVGIFYPNAYDEFETIDYESYNSNLSVGQKEE